MTDPYTRIQEHLGTALRKLSLFDVRVPGAHDQPTDPSRCLADLQAVAQEFDQAFEAIKEERRRLATAAEDADAIMRRARRLFGASPNPCLVLQRQGAAIADVNAAASRLLNVSQRHLIGKTFTNFLQQDREVFLRQLTRGSDVPAAEWCITVRPRERALVQVVVNAIVDNDETIAILLLPAVPGGRANGRAAEYGES